MPCSACFSQRRRLLLLVWRQDLINLRHRRPSDGCQLTHFAALSARELLDLRHVIGLHRSPQRLPRLLQLLRTGWADCRASWKIALVSGLLRRRQIELDRNAPR